MRHFPHKFLLTLFISSLAIVAFGQNSSINNAEKLYRNDNFIEALPLYATLVQENRTNRVFHHRLGVCLLKTNGSLVEAERHLNYAKSKGIRYANFFLGQVYKKQYKFDDAIAAYTTYLRGIRSDHENYNFVKQEIEHCKNLNTYLQRTEEIEVLSAQTVPIKDFYTHYKLSKESGKILSTLEINNNADTSFVMYMNELGDRICYPRIIGDTLDTDLFSKSRLLEKWGVEEHLSSVVNSEGDELYPYILDDGITLYFSSNGHGGLGGYDIFVTRYNPQTNKYLTPTNLGMPYNSIGDDFLFAKDEFNNLGWFASTRNNKEGEITIYSFKPNEFKKTSQLKGDTLIWAARLLIIKNQGDSISPGYEAAQNTTSQSFKEEDREIYFVVNDTLIYKSTLQFVSAEALHLLKTGERNLSLLAQYKKEIAQKREQFASLKSEAERLKASQSILELENKIYDMEANLETPFQMARNKEMEILAKNDFQIFSRDDYAIEQKSFLNIDTPSFTLPTIQENYNLIFSDEEIRHFLVLDRATNKEQIEISILENAPEILNSKSNSTTKFWRKLRTVDTSFQYADTLPFTLDLVDQNLQKNYLSLLNHSLDKVDILEKKAQLLYLFVHGEEFQNTMTNLLIKAEIEKNNATEKLININDTLINRSSYNDIKSTINSCQEMYEFSLVYYIEDYGGSLSLVPDSLVNDSAYIASLVNQLQDTTLQVSEAIVANRTNDSRLLYHLQLGAFSKPVSPEKIESLKDIKVVRLEDDNMLRYMKGPYYSKEEAKNDIKTVERYGFKGAFVVPFIDGNQVTWEEEKAFKTSQ